MKRGLSLLWQNNMFPIKRKYLTLILILLLGGRITGQTLEEISIVDSETAYFLTLTFDQVPKYSSSEVYEPPSFTIMFAGTKWEKGDFARRVMTDPLYQYSIKIATNSFGREDLQLRLDFFANTQVKINQSGSKKIIISWPKFFEEEDLIEEPDSTTLDFSLMTVDDALNQKVSLNFKNAVLQDVVRLLTTSYGLNVIIHPALMETPEELLDIDGQLIPDMPGNINLSLKDVTVETAMDLILKINGFDWYLNSKNYGKNYKMVIL